MLFSLADAVAWGIQLFLLYEKIISAVESCTLEIWFGT